MEIVGYQPHLEPCTNLLFGSASTFVGIGILNVLAVVTGEPKMTLAQAETIFDEWGSGDAETLFATALLVCKERTSIPLSENGTDPTDNSS